MLLHFCYYMYFGLHDSEVCIAFQYSTVHSASWPNLGLTEEGAISEMSGLLNILNSKSDLLPLITDNYVQD